MKNKKSPISGLISFVVFIVFIQFFFTGRNFNFSYIFIFMAIVGGLQALIRYLGKQTSKGEETSTYNDNPFKDYDEDHSYHSRPKNKTNMVACDYCGHMNKKETKYCENCGAQQLPPDQY